MTMKLSTKKPQGWNASVYYRILQPTIAMSNMGLIEPFIDDGSRDLPLETVAMAAAHSDIFWDYQRVDEGFEIISRTNSTRKAYWRSDKTWGAAPILVMDTDDDLFNVLPLNPAFRFLGWHVNGKPLEEKQYVAIEMNDGSKAVLYQDGMRGFDVKKNHATINQFRKNLSVADLVTCSTPRVEEYVKREVPDANTFVIPNCINFNDYPKVELAEHPGEVRIFWQGSTTHHEDMHPLRHVMQRISEKYPHVKWIFWGAHYKWLTDLLPADRVEFIPWCDYTEYKLRLSMLNFDINLAPLHPALFNQSRSAIKVYEAAALTRPVMSIAQRTGAYNDELIEGETALLFETPEQFEAQLCRAIEDAQLRKQIGENMQQWLRDNRDPFVWARALAEKMESLVIKRKELIGPPEENADGVPDDVEDLRAGEDRSGGGGGEAADDGDEGPGGPGIAGSVPEVEPAQLEVDH